MTLDELLQLARAVQADRDRRPEEIDEDDGMPVEFVRERLARAVLSLLSASPPCGFPEVTARDGYVHCDALGSPLSADDARGLAVALLRAAGGAT